MKHKIFYGILLFTLCVPAVTRAQDCDECDCNCCDCCNEPAPVKPVVKQQTLDVTKLDMKLRFKVGTDILVKDSKNDSILNDVTIELRKLGGTLEEVHVTGCASPDGTYKSNVKLATARSKKALALVKERMKSDNTTKYDVAPAKVYTWGDVAEKLEKGGQKSLAKSVRSLMGKSGYEGGRKIAKLRGYAKQIKPILEDLRIMRVSYKLVEIKEK